MFNYSSLFRLEIIREVLSVFWLYSVIFLLLLLFVNQQIKSKLKEFDETLKITIAILGLIFLVIFPFEFFYYSLPFFKSIGISVSYLPWISFCLILSTQLFWISKARKNLGVRIFVMLLLSFSVEKYVILITAFHRDYLPATWGGRFDLFDFGLKYLILFLILIVLSSVVYVFIKLFKRLR